MKILAIPPLPPLSIAKEYPGVTWDGVQSSHWKVQARGKVVPRLFFCRQKEKLFYSFACTKIVWEWDWSMNQLPWIAKPQWFEFDQSGWLLSDWSDYWHFLSSGLQSMEQECSKLRAGLLTGFRIWISIHGNGQSSVIPERPNAGCWLGSFVSALC